MTRITVVEAAWDEFFEASGYYDRETPGLGEEFENEVEHGLARLAENPYVGPEVPLKVRQLVLDQFPYSIIYRIFPDHVEVLAFAHHRRRFGYWRKRT